MVLSSLLNMQGRKERRLMSCCRRLCLCVCACYYLQLIKRKAISHHVSIHSFYARKVIIKKMTAVMDTGRFGTIL
jgi:hypothetical protein